MKPQADFYDSHYGQLDDEVYRAIRAETFGEDLGQESWITADECDRFAERLGLQAGQRVLEVACGSGGLAARIAARRGASVVGTDVNALAIRAANARAAPAAGRLEFLTANADEPLPFPDGSFEAVICNDAINHFRNRLAVLGEWKRVLRKGGRCLYTDPVVVTGLVSKAELEARSSIGFFLFSGVGANEALLKAAGFQVERADDVTDGVAQVSRRWHDAREKRRLELIPLEGEAKYDAVQRFLAAVHTLASEGRLSRFAFLGRR